MTAKSRETDTGLGYQAAAAVLLRSANVAVGPSGCVLNVKPASAGFAVTTHGPGPLAGSSARSPGIVAPVLNAKFVT